MQEKIILAPGASGSELLRSLALKGKQFINTKIMGAGELAEYALICSGNTISQEFISIAEENTFIAEAVQNVKKAGNTYFGEKISFSDVQELTNTIRNIRNLTDNDEEKEIEESLKKGPFVSKNEAILKIYKQYISSLKEKNKIDLVSLIRIAIDKKVVLSNVKFTVLEEYSLTPLEQKLLDIVSQNKINKISILDLFGKKEDKIKIESYKSCYGAPNEVEAILDDIYSSKKIDECTIAIADIGTYSQLFFDNALLYDIPTTFGCGIPIMNSNPAKLLRLYYQWKTSGFYGSTALKTMLESDSFDRGSLKKQLAISEENFKWKDFYDNFSFLRLTDNHDVNVKKVNELEQAIKQEEKILGSDDKDVQIKWMYFPYVKKIADELSLPIEDFIVKYARVRKGNKTNNDKLFMALDNSARTEIYEQLKLVHDANQSDNMDDVIVALLAGNVCKQSSQEGFLHITSIKDALTTVRKNLYVAGLSADNFPGAPKEHYLLLDEDVEKFSSIKNLPEANSFTSKGRIEKKGKGLKSLVKLNSFLDSKIYLSFSRYNVSDLKKENASSVLYDFFVEEKGVAKSFEDFKAIISKVDYFDPKISNTREIGKAYVDNKLILSKEDTDKKNVGCVDWTKTDKKYSASALEMFFKCKKKFMYKYILGLQEPDDDESFEIISPADQGTLAHELMQELSKSSPKMSEGDFLKKSEEYYDRYMLQNPPLLSGVSENVKKEFLEMMKSGYGMYGNPTPVFSENDLEAKSKSQKIVLHGKPDLIEKISESEYKVVDYKTGSRLRHEENDFDSCFQILFYSYLFEQNLKKLGLSETAKVTEGIFKYIALNEKISCQYNEEMRLKFNEKIEQFEKCLETGNFKSFIDEQNEKSASDETDGADEQVDDGKEQENPCEYCPFVALCNK